MRLDEVARIYDGVENDKTASWYNDRRTIYLGVQRQPGANTVEVVDSIRALLPGIQQQLPASLALNIRSDRSVSIRESVHDIKFTLVLTVALVVMVIFLFLRNLSATIIPSLALPASIVGTFAAMSLLGFSLDNMSLMALTLAVGFVVDDAIVMLENIVRRMEHGEDAMTAALRGSREIGFTIVSMTISLAAVFIPVLFMGGVVGRLLHEFAVTIGVAILISGLVSLTLTPMLSARFLKPPAQRHGALYMAIERVFTGSLNAYGWSLRKAMTHHRVTMAISALLLVATYFAFRAIPMGFIPSQDTGQLSGQTEMAQGLGFEAVMAKQTEVLEILRADPNVLSVTSNIGGGAGSNGGRLNIELRPREERQLSADEVIDALRPKLSVVPGVRVFLQNPPVINLASRQARAQYQFTIQDGDTKLLYDSAPKLEARLRELNGIVDVSSDLQLTNPQVNVALDRARIAALGLTVDQVASTLSTAFGQRQVAVIYAPNNAYQVIMRVAPEYQRDASALALLYLRTPSGQQVPLSSLTQIEHGRRAAVGQSHGPAAVGDAVVQPPARRRARRRGDAGRRGGAPDAAGVGRDQLPGQRPGLPGFHARPRAHPADGDLRDLRRPRHPLRELHPPAHDSLGTAVGRPRRARYAARLRRRPQSLRVRRRHHARRAREEERHHDDRLRHRGAAHARGRRRRRRCTKPAWCASARS